LVGFLVVGTRTFGVFFGFNVASFATQGVFGAFSLLLLHVVVAWTRYFSSSRIEFFSVRGPEDASRLMIFLHVVEFRVILARTRDSLVDVVSQPFLVAYFDEVVFDLGVSCVVGVRSRILILVLFVEQLTPRSKTTSSK
jgi:hypothetical protein